MRRVAVSIERVCKCLIAGLFAAIVMCQMNCNACLSDHDLRLMPQPTPGIFAFVK
jgi:hypothetical protein